MKEKGRAVSQPVSKNWLPGLLYLDWTGFSKTAEGQSGQLRTYVANGPQCHHKEIKDNSEIRQGGVSRRESGLQVPGAENCLLKGEHFLQIALTYQAGYAWIPHAVSVTSKCQGGDLVDLRMLGELGDLGGIVSHNQNAMLLMTMCYGVYHKYPLPLI